MRIIHQKQNIENWILHTPGFSPSNFVFSVENTAVNKDSIMFRIVYDFASLLRSCTSDPSRHILELFVSFFFLFHIIKSALFVCIYAMIKKLFYYVVIFQNDLFILCSTIITVIDRLRFLCFSFKSVSTVFDLQSIIMGENLDKSLVFFWNISNRIHIPCL